MEVIVEPKQHIKRCRGRPRLYTPEEVKERLKMNQQKYREKNGRKIREYANDYAKNYYAENKEKLVLKSRAHYQEKKEEISKKNKEKFVSNRKIIVPTEAQMKQRIAYEKAKEKKKEYYQNIKEEIKLKYLAKKQNKNVL